jgi:translation initiation factor IF-3
LRFPTRYNPKQRADEMKYVYGRGIRDQKIICIDQNNTNLGLLDTRDAIQLAQKVNLELVIVSHGRDGKPSTARILDFSKYKYEQEKREKQVKKKQRENEIKLKEVKFRPSTGENDLQIKATQLKEFLDEGNRIKVIVMFKGREMAHKEVGMETMTKFISMIGGQIDGQTSMSGKNLSAIIIKKAA